MATARIVLIQGHPDASAPHLCHALAGAYARGAAEAGHEVRTIDVATIDFALLRSQHEWELGLLPASLRPAQEGPRAERAAALESKPLPDLAQRTRSSEPLEGRAQVTLCGTSATMASTRRRGSIGLARCTWNPAARLRAASSDDAYAVSATAGTPPPWSRGRARRRPTST